MSDIFITENFMQNWILKFNFLWCLNYLLSGSSPNIVIIWGPIWIWLWIRLTAAKMYRAVYCIIPRIWGLHLFCAGLNSISCKGKKWKILFLKKQLACLLFSFSFLLFCHLLPKYGLVPVQNIFYTTMVDYGQPLYGTCILLLISLPLPCMTFYSWLHPSFQNSEILYPLAEVGEEYAAASFSLLTINSSFCEILNLHHPGESCCVESSAEFQMYIDLPSLGSCK